MNINRQPVTIVGFVVACWFLFPHSNTHRTAQHTEQHGCSNVRQLSEQFGLSLETAVCPHLFFCISFTGSILKSTGLVPESYFSNSRNVLNLYFVKVSWGWTIVLLLPFIFYSNLYNRSHTFVLRRLTSLLVATFIWYTCTETFFYIEDITGSCYESDTFQVIHGDITTKAACKKAGFIWDGFDISGHSFILAYSSLVIVEEMVPMLHIPQSERNIRLDCLYIALNVIVAIWIWMFGCTSVYFHDIIDKIIGTLCGILGWYVTYVVWYPMPFSPGLPPQQKQHA